MTVETRTPAERTGDQPADVVEIHRRAADLPSWRRPRQLRRQLAVTLVATALASVLLVGGLNFVAARDLLDEGTEDQLVGVGSARARTIETGVERLLGRVSAVSGDLGLVTALEELSREFAALDDVELTAGQETALESYYEETVVARFDEVGLGPVTTDRFLPESDAARYLQYHYTVLPAEEGVESRAVVDAGDGSGYSAAHEVHHEALTAMLIDSFGATDAMLATVGGDVVYTVDKRIDFGTNLVTGPYDESNLANVVRDRLTRVRVGTAIMVDVELYVPELGEPVFFATVAIRNDTEIVGILAIQLPAEALTRITTSDEQWERFGLQSGESYLVGGDQVLRTESRKWLEDPDAYLRGIDDDETAGLIEALDTTVGLQAADTKPVRSALDGDEFRGSSTNYLGSRNFSYSRPIAVPGVDWVVVVDVPTGDARAPLRDYAVRLGVVLLIVLPAAALAGLWLARKLTRPIGPVLDAATSIVEGERSPTMPDLGNDEFGDLGRRLENMAGELGERELALAAEYDERRRLMLAVLPPRLVDEDGQVAEGGDLADVATVVAVTIDTNVADLLADGDREAELLDQIAAMARDSADDRSLERVRASADGYLYLAGVGSDDDGVDEALGFVRDQLSRFVALCEREDLELGLRVGVATGPIATGVLDTGSLTFGAWGLPVRQASALAAMSESNQVLVEAATAEAATDTNDLSRADDIIALDGEPMDLYTIRIGAPVEPA